MFPHLPQFNILRPLLILTDCPLLQVSRGRSRCGRARRSWSSAASCCPATRRWPPPRRCRPPPPAPPRPDWTYLSLSTTTNQVGDRGHHSRYGSHYSPGPSLLCVPTLVPLLMWLLTSWHYSSQARVKHQQSVTTGSCCAGVSTSHYPRWSRGW